MSSGKKDTSKNTFVLPSESNSPVSNSPGGSSPRTPTPSKVPRLEEPTVKNNPEAGRIQTRSARKKQTYGDKIGKNLADNKRKVADNNNKKVDDGSINTQLGKFLKSGKRKEKDEIENDERPSGENPFIEGLSILESANDQTKTSVDQPTIMSMLEIVNKNIHINKELNEKIIRRIEETDYNVYRLSESVEEMKIKLDDLLEIQLSNKNIKKAHSKTLYHLSGTIPRLLMEASDEEIKDMVHQMRERCFGVDGKDRIENMRLRKFLDDNTIKKKALEFIQNEGKFCKYVADILIPNSQILKFYFPSEHTRRNKNELFGRDIVKAFMITAKYLGAGIISEFKYYLSHGIHLVNTRTGDKVKRKANVTFFELSHKPTFFSEEEIVSQENDMQE